ncbi:MAG: S-formylglutathione hydrolase [Alphaproteobacteria bacterium]|nr:S-formylglutathione hydrolase [Alphaproteobacteria bacterium]
MEILNTHKTFGGTLRYVRHESAATGTKMRFSVFTPPGEGPFPVLFFLAGLTCTEENFTAKANAYGAAAKAGLMVVAPDTSPRGEGVADDPAYDLGQGAGFYVDATEAPWAPHFRMYSYIAQDLQQAVLANFPADAKRRGITGHSMGGHGALTIALRNPQTFRSVSAFAPIVSPLNCPWGEKALTAYLGPDKAAWRAHDTTALIEDGAGAAFDDILVDQGLADQFLEGQLKPELLEHAAAKARRKVSVRRHEGYDHSYFFIASFMADHIAFHAARL